MPVLPAILAFGRDCRGGFTVTFALTAMAMMLAMGCAVDLARLSVAKWRAQEIADMIVKRVVALPSAERPDPIPLAQSARALFAAEFGAGSVGPVGVAFGGRSPAITLNVQVEISLPTLFVQMIGIRTIKFVVSPMANAQSALPGTPPRLVK